MTVPREGIEPPIDDYKSSVIPFNYRGLFSIRLNSAIIQCILILHAFLPQLAD